MSVTRVVVKVGEVEHEATMSPDNAYVTIEYVCPSCAAKRPLAVVGKGIRDHNHDTYFSTATCRACGAVLGEMAATVSTLFGIEEDNRVLHGRPRVY